MGWGLVFATRFADAAHESNSPEFGEWVHRTMCFLHRGTEALLESSHDAGISRAVLMREAFGMHAEAYLRGGFLDLDLVDKWRVIQVIGLRNLFRGDSRGEVGEVVEAWAWQYRY
jgi:hypothetical protein